MTVLDSQRTKSPSSTVGMSPLGLSARYFGSSLPPNGPPMSMRSKGMPSSSQHQRTFWTFEDVWRPHILSLVIAGFSKHLYILVAPALINSEYRDRHQVNSIGSSAAM